MGRVIEFAETGRIFEMDQTSTHEVTQLLVKWSNGDKTVLDNLMPLVSEELRRLAPHYISRERAGHTLQTTALVYEAYLRLVNRKGVQWQNRVRWLGLAFGSLLPPPDK